MDVGHYIPHICSAIQSCTFKLQLLSIGVNPGLSHFIWNCYFVPPHSLFPDLNAKDCHKLYVSNDNIIRIFKCHKMS